MIIKTVRYTTKQLTCLCRYIQAELRLRWVEFHQSQVDVRNKKQKVSMLHPIVRPILNICFPSHHILEKVFIIHWSTNHHLLTLIKWVTFIIMLFRWVKLPFDSRLLKSSSHSNRNRFNTGDAVASKNLWAFNRNKNCFIALQITVLLNL